jgi:hypothetical protein
MAAQIASNWSKVAGIEMNSYGQNNTHESGDMNPGTCEIYSSFVIT